MKKTISILLLFSMLLSLPACGNTPDSDTETTDDTSADATSVEDDTSAEDIIPDNIPEGTDLGGATVNIYVRGDTIDTEFDSEETGDIVDDAIFMRNRAIEEKLNVKLEYTSNTSADYWSSHPLFMSTVRASVLSNDCSIDIAAGLANIMPYLAHDGMFVNLLDRDVPYLNFDSPWWLDNFTEELTVKDRLYLATGEASLGIIKGVMCFYFNKDMVEKYGLEDPYELVLDGKWTLDKLSEMISGMYIDLNMNSEVDNEDQFGFYHASFANATNFIHSSGMRLTEKDSDGLPYYDLGSEKIISLIDRIDIMMRQDSFESFLKNLTFDGINDTTDIFSNGRSLFLSGKFSDAELFRDMRFNFGILPYPKYDENQENYITSSRMTSSLFGILKTADVKKSAAVLEALARENYVTVTPAYYEKALKIKYSRDDVSSQMFDLIKSHIIFDFGVIHGVYMNNIINSIQVEMSNPTGKWSSTWASLGKSVNRIVKKYVDDIVALPE